MVAICLLILVGAFAKSAQLPLHTWLPDAMEGPTPVSALIHAATMVTAGVYLIARMHPLFLEAPTAADISAFLGLATLIFAATVALAVTDLKRIIAYSTISQIGYMVVGVSIGAYAAGLFHLMTHAFFKALLFMAAGSVIAAMAGTQNIDRMGGFRRALPFTSALLIVGALALAAFPGTCRLLLQGRDPGLRGRARRLLLDPGDRRLRRRLPDRHLRLPDRLPGRLPRAMSRGPGARAGTPGPRGAAEPDDRRAGGHGRRLPRPRAPDRRAGEADGDRDGGAGLRGRSSAAISRSRAWTTSSTRSWRRPSRTRRFTASTFPPASAWAGLAVGAALGLLGIATAYYLYVVAPQSTERLRTRAHAIHAFLIHKWYFDELYDALVYRPLIAIGRFANAVLERVVVQGIVAGTVGAVRGVGVVVRGAQSGFVRAYALLVVGGFAALGLYFLIVSS